MHHHHCHGPPAHHYHNNHHHHHGHHTPCSPDPPFPRQQGLCNPAFWPSPLPTSCSSSSSPSGNTDASCTVHVEVPATAEAPLLEPRPCDDGAVPTAPLPAIVFGAVFLAIFAWIVYSYWF